MSVSDLIRKKTLENKRRKEAAKKYHKEREETQEESVRQLILGEKGIEGLSKTAYEVRKYYYEAKTKYHGNTYNAPAALTARSKTLWERVANACLEAKKDPKKYMDAQIEFYHKSFGKYPDLKDLATPAAISRAKDFEIEKKHAVVGNNTNDTIKKVELYKEMEKFIQKTMRANKISREEFYLRFVLSGVYSLPKEFVESDPAYKRAKA